MNNNYTNYKRVICTGVFDLCHLGHMQFFEKIYKYFEERNIAIKLIVGVYSDYTCELYKRKPIISQDIRYETLKYCKYVDEILEDAPLQITYDFIKKYNIDYVGISMEYKDTEKDVFFHKGAIDMNINIYVDRCDIISSTDIIKKCKNFL
jgi:choline-phosphate cytidylyltransferase